MSVLWGFLVFSEEILSKCFLVVVYRDAWALRFCHRTPYESLSGNIPIFWKVFLTIKRMEDKRWILSAEKFRFPQSFARRQQWVSQAMVRSTIHRFGNTWKPDAVSNRFTISICKFWTIGPSAALNKGR
jgi:hypothetical protein